VARPARGARSDALAPAERKAGGARRGAQAPAEPRARLRDLVGLSCRLDTLGDDQYQNGYYSDFENSFDRYWEAFKFLQRPSQGNHEFYDNHGQTGVRGLGYFDYYNGIQHTSNGSEIDDIQPGQLAPDLAQRQVRGRARRVQPEGLVVQERDAVASERLEQRHQQVHAHAEGGQLFLELPVGDGEPERTSGHAGEL
jgi:hypothetical protein